MKKLSEIGERKAIEIISKFLSKGDFDIGLGDDCAAIEFEDNYILVTTDMISEKTHIPKEMTPFQIGWFVVAINLSDIAAKGGVILGVVLSYGLPSNISDVFLSDLTKGANACATKFSTNIIGGDTKETSEITICGTAIGIVKKDRFMPRNRAHVDDVVAVTGPLGSAGASYFNLKDKILDIDISKYLFEPVPRLKEGRLLAKQNCVSCCMDLSDGLSSSLYQLSELNGLGFEIYLDKIPISKELLLIKDKNLNFNECDYALHFGGDYELLLTIPKSCFEKTKQKMIEIGSNLYAIGYVTKRKDVVLILDDSRKILENKGYEHFKNHFF